LQANAKLIELQEAAGRDKAKHQASAGAAAAETNALQAELASSKNKVTCCIEGACCKTIAEICMDPGQSADRIAMYH